MSLYVPLGAHSLVGGDVDCVGHRLVANGQTKVSNGTGAVLLHQYVLRLKVSVGDARLT